LQHYQYQSGKKSSLALAFGKIQHLNYFISMIYIKHFKLKSAF